MSPRLYKSILSFLTDINDFVKGSAMRGQGIEGLINAVIGRNIESIRIEKNLNRTDFGRLSDMARNGEMGLTSEIVRNIQDAYDQRHVEAMVARDVCGKPLALMIANSNYSSFRTVYGYKVEVMELTNNPALALKGMEALTDKLTDIAKDKNHEGHINIFINQRSRPQVNLIDNLNGIEFMMSDHPNSHLDLYAIDRAVIHGLNPKLAKLDNVYQIDSYAKPGKFIIGR